jgi:3-oxoacyl-(acyl-carrier-protein) synthase
MHWSPRGATPIAEIVGYGTTADAYQGFCIVDDQLS